MIVGSTFSGVGGMDLGLMRAGMEHAFFCELDPWRQRVLDKHWPEVPCFEDVRDLSVQMVNGLGIEEPDLLVGGFPCQDVSLAGRRAGFDGERSSLFHEFARLAYELEPDWILLENVLGLLSSNDGRDMAAVLETLARLGYGVAWRVLDAQYFGVAQQRRRVFVVGRLGGQSASEVCAHALCSDWCPEPPEGAWKKRGPRAQGSAGSTGVVGSLTAKKNGWRIGADETGGGHIIATLDKRDGGVDVKEAQGGHDVPTSTGARRLTPTEMERLMGWPDDWTLVDGEPVYDQVNGRWLHQAGTSDSARIAACGDGVVAPVAEWIGRRIMAASQDATLGP